MCGCSNVNFVFLTHISVFFFSFIAACIFCANWRPCARIMWQHSCRTWRHWPHCAISATTPTSCRHCGLRYKRRRNSPTILCASFYPFAPLRFFSPPQLPVIAKAVGKPVIKKHLDTLLPHLAYSLRGDHQLSATAARECVAALSALLGPSIFRGRVELCDPSLVPVFEPFFGRR